MYSGLEFTLSKFVDDFKLSDASDSPERRDVIQRYFYRFEKWSHVNLTKFNKVKCMVLHMGQGNPQYQYRLGDELVESSPAEKDQIAQRSCDALCLDVFYVRLDRALSNLL